MLYTYVLLIVLFTLVSALVYIIKGQNHLLVDFIKTNLPNIKTNFHINQSKCLNLGN